MKLLPILLILLMLFPISASAKIIGNFSSDLIPLKTVTLAQAKVNESNVSESKTIETPTTDDSLLGGLETKFESAVSNGIKTFFTGAADEIFNIGGSNNQTTDVKNKYGYAVGSVYKIATHENDPYQSATVQEMRKRTTLIALFIFLIFVFLGATRVNLSCGGMTVIDRMEYTVTETVSALSEYKDVLIIALAAMIGIHYIFKFTILFNQAVTTESMYGVVESIPLTMDNWVMYCAMAICYGIESIFFVMRIILMGLIAGSDILIGALFALPFTRTFALEIVKYFIKITLMQFIIVLLTAFGISIIQESPFFQPLGYLCLILILMVVSGGIIFGFAKIFSTAKKVAWSYR